MTQPAGSRIGPYEVVSLLGAGGMGEVYRARDTKLNREIAIKVLLPSVADDPDRLARFSREAQVLASLNHPNIAHLYGLEGRDAPDGGTGSFLVMELVDGHDLSQRIARGAIPLAEALPIAKQIADALEAAHDASIVHRDLKPANVKITPHGVVKVLDFGLAAVVHASGPQGMDATFSPTLSLHATQAGIILGTAAYMSPEQASGKVVDRRADIWSFGVVLWEMLSGRRLFEGETISHTLADVLRAPIDFAALPSDTPAGVRDLLRRCLDRDVRSRLRDIGEARIAIEKTLAAPSIGAESSPAATAGAGAVRARPWLAWSVAAATGLVAVLLAFVHFRERPTTADVIRFYVQPPEKGNFAGGAPALSPDGRKLAFMATGADGHRHLWVRPIDELNAHALAGADDAGGELTWSPDSRSIVFGVPTLGKLKKIDISGGPSQTLCDTRAQPFNAWSPDGVIVFRAQEGLSRVSAAGGPCTPLTQLDARRGELRHTSPSFLPDGRHFVYFRVSRKPEDSGIYVGSLDVAPERQSADRLLASDTGALYAPSPEATVGYLLFQREGSLMAQPFDPRRLVMAGDAVRVADQLDLQSSPDTGAFAVSATGTLAYRVSGGALVTQLIWYGRDGKATGPLGEPGSYNTVALSPDGTRVAFDRRERRGNAENTDLWIHDLARGTSTRFTFDPGPDWVPVWSPDGSRIAFSSSPEGQSNLYQRVSNGAGESEAILKSPDPMYPQDWSPDGRFLLYSANLPNNFLDLMVLPMDGPASGERSRPRPFLATPFRESQARFSPDGRFVAYTSDASGRSEVYVRPFAPDGNATGQWMVSKDGGGQPRWRRDGKELFYVSGDSKLVAVPVTTHPTFQAGEPAALFAMPIWGGGATGNVHRWDVTPDGKRFLITVQSSESAASPLTIVLNWTSLLKR